MNRTYGAWTVAIALLVVMGLVYLTSTVVLEAVQAADQRSSSTPTPIVVTPSRPDTRRPCRCLKRRRPMCRHRGRGRPCAAAPTRCRRPPPPAVQGPRCADPRAVISSPGINAAVSGMVPIVGTAAHPQFQYYKLEYGAGPTPSVWSYFDGGDRAVQGGRLGTLNASALAPGTYAIRVVVVDKTGNFVEPCQTVVVIR